MRLRHLVEDQRQQIVALQHENAELITSNQQLAAEVVNYKGEVVELGRTISIMNDTITDLQTKVGSVNRCVELAKLMVRNISGYHHLGDFAIVDNTDKELKVTGTTSAWFGLHPLDKDPKAMPSRFEFNSYDGRFVCTYDWRVYDDMGHPFYYALTTPPTSRRHFEYPVTTLSGFVGEAFDPNPPNPGWHVSGLLDEVRLWRTSIWQPDYEQQNQRLINTVSRWSSRINPFVMQVDQLLNRLVSL